MAEILTNSDFLKTNTCIVVVRKVVFGLFYMNDYLYMVTFAVLH